MRLEGTFYIYAEYCPGDFFWGWWLYAAPILEDGTIDRKHYIWLDYDWRLAALARDTGLMAEYPWGQHPTARNRTTRTICERFLRIWPCGVVCQVSGDGRSFVVDSSHADRLWDHSRHVREQQLLDWKNAAREESDARAATKEPTP